MSKPNQTPDFDDIADINAFFEGKPTTPIQARPAQDIEKIKIHAPAPEAVASGFTQKCQHCRGTGKFVSFSGRTLGPCFKCQGKGEINFKTSPQVRAKASASRANSRANREAEKAAWREEHKELISWLRKENSRFLDACAAGKNPTFDFTHKMAEAIDSFGTLTDAQLAAVQKCKAKSDERRATWKEQNQRQDVAIDCTKIQAAFDRVRAKARAENSDVMQLKLHFNNFSFSPDRRDASVIWVNSKHHTNDRGLPAALGKIQNGKLSPFRLATPEIVAEIKMIAEDVGAAARATGLKFNFCCCCGAMLTNEESRRAGIGPICREKWGF